MFKSHRGMSNKPFGTPLRKQTISAYASTVSKLLMALMKGTTHLEDFTFHTSQLLETELEYLRGKSQVTDPKYAITTKDIHQVLKALWLHHWPEDLNPTFQFLNFHCLRSTGEFMTAAGVTPILAQLEFAIRLVCLYEIDLLTNQMKMWSNQADCFQINIKHWVRETLPSTFQEIIYKR
jgi:hypothetical protein